MSLSAIIISLNEKKCIKRCIDSLAFAQEIIVVDSGSTDGTIEIARECGAKVYVNKWLGYGTQKNWGLSKAKCDWVIFVDADEVVTPQLGAEIQDYLSRVKEDDNTDFVWLKIVTVFLGKKLNHLYGHNLRLFRKKKGRWDNKQVHEQVQKNGKTIKLDKEKSVVLDAPLLHYSHETIKSYVKKMHHYTTLDARQMAITDRHRSGKKVKDVWWLPYFLAGKQLIKLSFYRQGIRDGWAGMVWCILSARYEWEMGKKYLKLK